MTGNITKTVLSFGFITSALLEQWFICLSSDSDEVLKAGLLELSDQPY